MTYKVREKNNYENKNKICTKKESLKSRKIDNSFGNIYWTLNVTEGLLIPKFNMFGEKIGNRFWLVPYICSEFLIIPRNF